MVDSSRTIWWSQLVVRSIEWAMLSIFSIRRVVQSSSIWWRLQIEPSHRWWVSLSLLNFRIKLIIISNLCIGIFLFFFFSLSLTLFSFSLEVTKIRKENKKLINFNCWFEARRKEEKKKILSTIDLKFEEREEKKREREKNF